MAAAEARAAWQRAANRCLVQEDAKRAPKLACCPSSSTQQHDMNNGNPTSSQDHPIPSFMPLSWNPMNSNLPPDTRWSLQLQPNFGYPKDLLSEQLNYVGGEVGEKKVDNSAPESKLEEPLLSETVDINPKKSEDFFEPPWMVSTAFMKHCSETGFEEFKTLAGYSRVPLKCQGNIGNYHYKDQELMGSKMFDPLLSEKPPKAACEMDAPWEEGEKPQPWWQVTNEDELASLVAERAMQHIENCDLPRPTQTVRVHRAHLRSPDNVDDYGRSSSPVGKVLHPGLCDPMQCSYNTASTDETNWSSGGEGQRHYERNNAYSGAQDSFRSCNDAPESKPTYQNDSERAQLLEALRHSQTRAREAEMAAKKACDEKDHIIKLLFRQASHLFACKQWLKMLQLENLCLQLKFKEHQIATMFPDFPWMMLKEKASNQERKDRARRKGRRPKGGGFCNAVIFALGLGLAGAGLLLGWTLGWLLPKL